MKQKLLLIILMVLPIMASAQSEIIKNVENDDLYYNLRPEDKIAIVVSNPYKRYAGDIVINFYRNMGMKVQKTTMEIVLSK